MLFTLPDNHLNVLYGVGFISPSLTIKHFENTFECRLSGNKKKVDFTGKEKRL